jgi:hypothetical protein
MLISGSSSEESGFTALSKTFLIAFQISKVVSQRISIFS